MSLFGNSMPHSLRKRQCCNISLTLLSIREPLTCSPANLKSDLFTFFTISPLCSLADSARFCTTDTRRAFCLPVQFTGSAYWFTGSSLEVYWQFSFTGFRFCLRSSTSSTSSTFECGQRSCPFELGYPSESSSSQTESSVQPN